tara:strand:- start:15032 stop:19360 length:4329 start_codon:yes stop_codon:yes gene_type:complete
MNKFIDKRNSLEQFVKEQIIGPGAYNNRFFFLKGWEQNEFKGKNINDIKTCPAIENISEVIPEVPAYQYSSAILFPETREVVAHKDIEIKEEELDESNNTEVNTSADDEEIVEDTSESVVSKQQNYPNYLGLSFVVNEKVDLIKDLNISLSFRKYSLRKKKYCFDSKIAIHVKEYQNEIALAIKNYFNTIFSSELIDDNLFIYPTEIFNNDILYEIDYKMLNNYFEDNLLSVINDVFKDDLIELNSKDQTTYFGIKGEYNRQFYAKASSKEYGGTQFLNVFSFYDDTVFTYIQEQLSKDISNYAIFKTLIHKIEIYNQLKELVTHLKSVFKKNKATPIWESKHYNEVLTLPPYEGSQKIYRSSEISINEKSTDLEGLKYLVQYFKKEKQLFVKIIIINKNEIILKEGEPKQLNKKDEANKKAVFGVKLKICENKKNCLEQYNPPQLLDFDEEDSFNKLQYRKYLDYGEGFNTSVTWGELNNLNYVATEFLPTQETPDVGVVPSKIVENKVVPRIQNDDVLSMRHLSTLTVESVSDENVLEGLTSFIEAYGGSNGWILENQAEISTNAKGLDDKSINLLNRQLLACEKDYKRLKRNIELLRKNPIAIAAFRTMNTAMFMQLHHSINVKDTIPFVPNPNSESYYKNVPIIDKEGKTYDYKWRPFQLGFILLNIDAFVQPESNDTTVDDVFKLGWPERNEIADMVWFPTGGGKTEAYLGIIAFTIAYRRFTKGTKGNGTTVLMRYTLRMLTLQQFQRATLLICALETIRKDNFQIPYNQRLGNERITIGMFVGGGLLPNKWVSTGENKGMVGVLKDISEQISKNKKIITSLPFTYCPWCGGDLFVKENLPNILPNHTKQGNNYGIGDQLDIACNSKGCTFHSKRSSESNSLPLRLFDEDIYKYPPTLIFGTVDKFASFANKVSNKTEERNADSRRLVGKGYGGARLSERDVLPPELIIQDELHLLLGPLGTSVGLFEKSIDKLCTYTNENNQKIKPKIVTSTATTRNTDKQVFALFTRRTEIFPKQGIFCDDSFFAFYKRKKTNVDEYESKRKYVGLLPIGKTQVWMQLRLASITLTHRLKYLKENFTIDKLFENPEVSDELKQVFNYYHTVLGYYNSLKDVGKTQSQLSHYLPGDVNYVIKNTIPWSFVDKFIRKEKEIRDSELTGRLKGEEVKTNLADIEKNWELVSKKNGNYYLNVDNPPEFIIATNMISVGIDVSRFNTMIISSMPRNIAEYIQASSRVARDEDGIVFTIHHPFRSRDISHYQKFKEFHEKFYSYVEPISVTPFASKALDRYLAMYVVVLVRHNIDGLMNNEDAVNINNDKIKEIEKMIKADLLEILSNSKKLEQYLSEDRTYSVKSSIDGIISSEEIEDVEKKLNKLLQNWRETVFPDTDTKKDIVYRKERIPNDSLFTTIRDDNFPKKWKVGQSLREIGASIVIKTVQQ